jgi:hypothetical protein
MASRAAWKPLPAASAGRFDDVGGHGCAVQLLELPAQPRDLGDRQGGEGV